MHRAQREKSAGSYLQSDPSVGLCAFRLFHEPSGRGPCGISRDECAERDRGWASDVSGQRLRGDGSRLKLCRQYHLERGEPERDRIISRRGSYHGNTLGALAVGGHAARRQPYEPLLMQCEFIDPCYEYRYRASAKPRAHSGVAWQTNWKNAFLPSANIASRLLSRSPWLGRHWAANLQQKDTFVAFVKSATDMACYSWPTK